MNLKGFCDFCKNNIPLLVATTIALFFCYGIKLFQYNLGIDTELFMADKAGTIRWSLQIGRFGRAFLESLLYTKGFNPFTAFLSTFCIIWLFTISWCYIIAVFSKNPGRNNVFIPFALVFISSPIWAEQFYFVMQSLEVALMVLICPYAIYFLFRGFLDNEKSKVAFAFLLIIFMTSVYQAMVPFFCCGVFICFMLFLKASDYEPSIYRNLCLKIFATLVGAMIVYLAIDMILIPSIFDIEKTQHSNYMIFWGQMPVKESIFRILKLPYIIFAGNVLPLENILGIEALKGKYVVNESRVFGNILLLPMVVFFIVKVIDIACKKIPKGRRFLYVLAGICIPLSIMFLAIVTGNYPSIRAIYVLPLAFAFMFFFLIETCSKKTAIAITILALFTAVHQIQITAQLFYSDQLRYNEDVRRAYDICDIITKTSDYKNLPVAIIGENKIAENFHANFLQGETIGRSFFEWNTREESDRGLDFMRSLGIHFNAPSGEQWEQAVNESNSMPSYPNPGYIKKLPNVIVVKF